MAARVSQTYVENVRSWPKPKPRVSQTYVEQIRSHTASDTFARVSQTYVENIYGLVVAGGRRRRHVFFIG